MGIGGIVVAAAYQAQGSEQREAAKSRAAQRVSLAQQRVALAAESLKTVERQASVGSEPQDALLEARFKMSEARAQLESVVLDAAEVDATGRDPQTTVSAPLVGGRDFVAEHWKIDLQIPRAAIDVEKARLQTLERRFAVGAANNIDVETSRSRLIELEAATQAVQNKIGIRERFLKKEIDGGLADLYVLQAEAEQRRQTLQPRMALAQKVLRDVQQKVEVGVAPTLDVSLAELKLKELELEMLKADVDLGVIRRQIDQRRAGR
jgi:outer membrane protein TolC